MTKRIQKLTISAKWLINCTVAILGISVAQYALAGKTNTVTDEKCVGLDCADLGDVEIPTNNTPPPLRVATVDTVDCTADETNQIHLAVDFLANNMAAINSEMGRAGLMAWPGTSRAGFVRKLGRPLEFHCINGKEKCDDLLGIVYPIVAQKRVNLCANSIRGNANARGINQAAVYAGTVAHEVAHLVRLNEHRKSCAERFNNPRFSQSVGLAAEHAHRGVPYDPALYSCGNATTWQEIVDQKLQPPKIHVDP